MEGAGVGQIMAKALAEFVTESSKSTEVLHIGISEVLGVVESEEWASTFAGIVQDATVMRHNESGIARIEAKFVAPTPCIPARTFSLLRFAKKLEEEEGSMVAVVEVSDPNGQRGHFNRSPLEVKKRLNIFT